MDVIFDARGQATTIFDVSTVALNQSHTQDFINGVTIRNARSTASSPFGAGAGVFIHGALQNQRTISNCFIVGNTVGIAVASDLTAPGQVHNLAIINNTIAWNAIGIWNGDAVLASPPSENALQVFNNLIDASPPNLTQYPVPVSSFEGLSEQQMQVAGLTGSAGGIPIFTNVNAWSFGFHNLSVGTANWPPVTVIGGLPVAARNDLTPYIGQGLRPASAVLYVSDALRITMMGLEYSRNDFRLSPWAQNALGQGARNPLVDRGIALPPQFTGYSALLTGIYPNWATFLRPPGPSSLGDLIDPPATVNCWDWDAEGFGNVRIASRTGFSSVGGFLDGPLPGIPQIDLGADEMGELIMAGYLEGTRIFSHNVPGQPSIIDHTRVFFLDLPSATYVRPEHNLLIGGLESPSIYYQWWQHVPSPVNVALSANYTRGNASPPSARYDLTTPPPLALPWQNRPVFMRNLTCDVAPHLIEDLHPLWSTYWSNYFIVPPFYPNALYHDVYGSHPWYDGVFMPAVGAQPPVHWGKWDNPYLFYNPGRTPYVPSDFVWGYIQYHNVTVGITSPPGSYYYHPNTPPYQQLTFPNTYPTYLLGGLPTATFGPFGGCAPVAGGTYSTNALGVGDAGPGCPDQLPVFPGLDGLGLRFNCQRTIGGTTGNSQTFLAVTTLSLNPIDVAARSYRVRQLGDTARALDMSSLRRAVDFARARR